MLRVHPALTTAGVLESMQSTPLPPRPELSMAYSSEAHAHDGPGSRSEVRISDAVTAANSTVGGGVTVSEFRLLQDENRILAVRTTDGLSSTDAPD